MRQMWGAAIACAPVCRQGFARRARRLTPPLPAAGRAARQPIKQSPAGLLLRYAAIHEVLALGRDWGCSASQTKQLLPGQWYTVAERLQRGLTITPAPLMRSQFIVLPEPAIEVGLQLFDAGVDLAAKRHHVKLIEHGPVEALDDAIGLGAFDLGAGVIDVLHRQVQLIFVAFAGAAILSAAVS